MSQVLIFMFFLFGIFTGPAPMHTLSMMSPFSASSCGLSFCFVDSCLMFSGLSDLNGKPEDWCVHLHEDMKRPESACPFLVGAGYAPPTWFLDSPFLDFGLNSSFPSTVLLAVRLRFRGLKYTGHTPGPELYPGHRDRALPAPSTWCEQETLRCLCKWVYFNFQGPRKMFPVIIAWLIFSFAWFLPFYLLAFPEGSFSSSQLLHLLH